MNGKTDGIKSDSMSDTMQKIDNGDVESAVDEISKIIGEVCDE